jgi:ActR/RegA family two-component response regulator
VDGARTAPSDVRTLTGYTNIATAVGAVKFGAIGCFAKSADADDVVSAPLVRGLISERGTSA